MWNFACVDHSCQNQSPGVRSGPSHYFFCSPLKEITRINCTIPAEWICCFYFSHLSQNLKFYDTFFWKVFVFKYYKNVSTPRPQKSLLNITLTFTEIFGGFLISNPFFSFKIYTILKNNGDRGFILKKKKYISCYYESR